MLTPPVVDGLGRVVVPAVDHWEPRSGIAVALTKISTFFDVDMVDIQSNIFFFVVETKLSQPLPLQLQHKEELFCR